MPNSRDFFFTMIKTTILVDGAFFLKRYRVLYKKNNRDPEKVANDLYTICHKHLISKKPVDQREHQESLYRIFYYDCYPLKFRHGFKLNISILV